MRTDSPPTIYLKDYQPYPYFVDHVSLDFRLHPTETRVIARFDMRVNPAVAGGPQPVVLNGEELSLNALSITGVDVPVENYVLTDDRLVIKSVPSEPFTLELETTCNPEGNTALSGLYRSSGNYCTQCEAEGFRRITFFPDRPDILSRYRVKITADKTDYPVLLSNGNPVLRGDGEGNDHFVIWEDPYPKPCYLFALVAGDLACVRDSFTTRSGRDVALEIYVEHGKEDRCGWAMESLKRSMKWDEEAFGREYDLEIFMIVAVSDFNMGAMENKGLNIFNDKFILARPDTATDTDYESIESIIAHEYFHNWSGNRVTCRDWFQLCLKEGFTVFRDQEFSSDVRSRPVERIGAVQALRAHQFPEDAGPLAHPVRPQSYMEINNFYTATVYEKGAEVVRMAQTLVGKETFRRAMDLYFARHDGEAATVEDFITCIEETSGRDLGQFFNWYNQAGTPQVIAEGVYDYNKETYRLTLTQSCAPTPGQDTKEPFHIPLSIGLVRPTGGDMELRERNDQVSADGIIELRASEQVFEFEHVDAAPILSINRSFSAPINLIANVSRSDRLALIEHDSDSFNRYEAAQEFYFDIVISQLKGNDESEIFNALCKTLKAVVSDNSLDPAFIAKMLAIPGDNEIAGRLGKNVDPDKVFAARNQLRAAIGNQLCAELEALASAPEDAIYSPLAGPVGQRALKSGALDLLAAGDPDRGARLAMQQFRNASHMTGKIHALNVLCRVESDLRIEALSAFYDDYRDDHLLVDKWFALQASVPFAETLGEIRALMQHEAFSLRKPNSVRALVGTFAAGNPVCFHQPDGAGYELFADTVIKLDSINPQVAARLCGAFHSWRILEPGRAALASQALKRIKSTPNLSKDTFEICERSLASS